MSERNVAPVARWNVGSYVYSVAISRDGTRIASGSGDSYVRLWDVRTGATVLGPLKGHSNWVRSVAFSPDDTRIVSGSWDHTIIIWDARTGASIGEPLSGHADSVRSVAFSHDSTRIVSGSGDRTIRIWDARTGVPLGDPLKGHDSAVWSVTFSNDSSLIISGSGDKTIRIWDAHTGALVAEPLRRHTGPVFSVAFSPDSTCIVSGSEWPDYTIRIWDARTGTPIGEPLKGHTSAIRSLAFSSDSTRIVSGSRDNTICIWDVRTGAPIDEPLKGHAGDVYSVVFSPDSSHIFSGSADGTIAVWQVPQSTPSHHMLAQHDSPSFDMVTSKMSAQEMFDCLVKHGCPDISSSIDPDRYSSTVIASGGFGDVRQAWLKDGILVAVKCLRLHLIQEGGEKGMKRITRELHHWSKARHENIQELLGIVMFQGHLGMVSLWMSNGHLHQYLEKFPDVDRYSLCVQVAKGVAYLHGIGMVHGDLKAINVLVSSEGIVKICDFDYSILLESTLRFSATTKSGGGTIRWMAPELLLHQDDGNSEDGEDEEEEKPLATRNMQTDVYALGMTILETISGKIPYHQFKHEVVVIRALERKELPRRPQALSGPDERATRMWSLLLTCWDHDPSARPDAASVLLSLQSFVK